MKRHELNRTWNWVLGLAVAAAVGGAAGRQVVAGGGGGFGVVPLPELFVPHGAVQEVGVSSGAGIETYRLPGGGVSTLSPIDPFEDLDDEQITIGQDQIAALAAEADGAAGGDAEATVRIEAPDTPGGQPNYVPVPSGSEAGAAGSGSGPATTMVMPQDVPGELQPAMPYYPEPVYIPPQIVIDQPTEIIYEPEVVYYPEFEPIFIERRRCLDFGIEVVIWDFDRDHDHDRDGHHETHGGTGGQTGGQTVPPAHPPVITSNPPVEGMPPLANFGRSIPAGGNRLGGLPVLAALKPAPDRAAVSTVSAMPVMSPATVPVPLRTTRSGSSDLQGVVKVSPKGSGGSVVTTGEGGGVVAGVRVVANSKLPEFGPPASPSAQVVAERAAEETTLVPAVRMPVIVRNVPAAKTMESGSAGAASPKVVVTPAAKESGSVPKVEKPLPVIKTEESKPVVTGTSKLPEFVPEKPAAHGSAPEPGPAPVIVHDVPAAQVVRDVPVPVATPAPIVIHEVPVVHEAPHVSAPVVISPPPSPAPSQADTHSSNAPDKLPSLGGRGR